MSKVSHTLTSAHTKVSISDSERWQKWKISCSSPARFPEILPFLLSDSSLIPSAKSGRNLCLQGSLTLWRLITLYQPSVSALSLLSLHFAFLETSSHLLTPSVPMSSAGRVACSGQAERWPSRTEAEAEWRRGWPWPPGFESWLPAFGISNLRGGGQVPRVGYCWTPFLSTIILTMDKCIFP